MLIVCPHCASFYELQPDRLGSGRSVRCVRCRTVWFATAPGEAPAGLEPAGASANRPDAAAEAGEQIEGGEFGWTFVPDHGAGEGAAAQGDGEAAASEADQAAGPETGTSEGEPQPPPPEAEPETVPDAPALAPVLDQEPPPPDEAKEPGEDVEALAAPRAKRAARRKRQHGWRPGLPFVAVGLAAVLAGLVAGRTQVVRFLPQTASLYGAIGLAVNLRGLSFENVRTTRETSDGVAVLVVEGTIVNVAARTVDVPRLRFGVRNAAGHEIYAWTSVPARTILAPGEGVEFRSRLASPPAEARDVVVRFFNRRDTVAGLR